VGIHLTRRYTLSPSVLCKCVTMWWMLKNVKSVYEPTDPAPMAGECCPLGLDQIGEFGPRVPPTLRQDPLDFLWLQVGVSVPAIVSTKVPSLNQPPRRSHGQLLGAGPRSVGLTRARAALSPSSVSSPSHHGIKPPAQCIMRQLISGFGPTRGQFSGRRA